MSYRILEERHQRHRPAETKALISCGIIKAEIEAALHMEKLDVPVFWLAPAPCIDSISLERQLKTALERSLAVADEAIVLIGRCHRSIDEIIGSPRARRLPIADCFDAMLGARRKQLDAEANTFYTLPSWLRHWKRALVTHLGWEAVDARQNFGLYQRILLLDAGVQPFCDEDILELFDFTGVPIDVVPVDLMSLRDLLRENLRSVEGFSGRKEI